MAINNKQTNFKDSGTELSAENFACENESHLNAHVKKKSHNRKILLLFLLILLAVTQVIRLLANTGFNNNMREPVTSTEIKKIIRQPSVINKPMDLKEDYVEIKSAEFEEIEVIKPVVPATLKKVEPDVIPVKKVVKTEAIQKIVPPVIVEVAVPETTKLNKPLYVKHDINGLALEEGKEKWSCVHDVKNALMWEVKSKDDPMRKSKNLYSWFDPDSKLKGVADGGHCRGDADCDTYSYVQVMNEQNFCGHNDWRMPTRKEMKKLLSYTDNNKSKININYFPETLPSWYWTASSNKLRPEYAWYVLFNNGVSLNALKESPKLIRLVRDAPAS